MKYIIHFILIVIFNLPLRWGMKVLGLLKESSGWRFEMYNLLTFTIAFLMLEGILIIGARVRTKKEDTEFNA